MSKKRHAVCPEGEQFWSETFFYKTLRMGLKFFAQKCLFLMPFFWHGAFFLTRCLFFDKNRKFCYKNAFFLTKIGNFVSKMPFFWRGAFFLTRCLFFDRNLKTDCQKTGTAGVYFLICLTRRGPLGAATPKGVVFCVFWAETQKNKKIAKGDPGSKF